MRDGGVRLCGAGGWTNDRSTISTTMGTTPTSQPDMSIAYRLDGLCEHGKPLLDKPTTASTVTTVRAHLLPYAHFL